MEYKTWTCVVCGFIYDELEGRPHEGIPAETAWSDVPTEWKCPDCGMGKLDFQMIEL